LKIPKLTRSPDSIIFGEKFYFIQRLVGGLDLKTKIIKYINITIAKILHLFMDSLIYWFIDLLIYWFIDSLIYWFIDFLFYRFIDLLTYSVHFVKPQVILQSRVLYLLEKGTMMFSLYKNACLLLAGMSNWKSTSPWCNSSWIQKPSFKQLLRNLLQFVSCFEWFRTLYSSANLSCTNDIKRPNVSLSSSTSMVP
jgi:hypothetical protein